MCPHIKLMNPIQLNDWEFKKYITVVVAVQFATFGSIGIDLIGLHIPILRQFICFIYLTFIPGVIILRILKLHKLGNAETMLYAVGLSIATLMFAGFLINTFYPYLGNSGPLSIAPLITTISLIVLVLCVLSYIRDRDFSDSDLINISDIFSPHVLFLCLLPFISIFGTYLVNFYKNNILLFILLAVISIIPIIIAFDRFPKQYFTLAIAVISISLLYHRSLISMNLWGSDMFGEYYSSKQVLETFFWDKTIYDNLNAMMSIAILPPIYSIVCDLSLVWIFKIIYPFIYSLVPLGLYIIFQKQTTKEISFLATFYYMSIGEFYGVLPVMARQEIAELFFMLSILLMINKHMNKIARALLFIISGMLLIVSHYAISYMFVFALFIEWLIILLINKFKRELFFTMPIRIINYNNVFLFFVFMIAWYMYISNSSNFDTFISIGNHIFHTISENFLNPRDTEGLAMLLVNTSSPLYAILKYCYLFSQFCIGVGIVATILQFFFIKNGNLLTWRINSCLVLSKIKLDSEYLILSCIYFGILVTAIMVPHFSSSLGTFRLFHIALVLLALFFIIGATLCFNFVEIAIKKTCTSISAQYSLKAVSIFLGVFLLLNSGFVHELVKDNNPCSISLSTDETYLSSRIFTLKEVHGAEFISTYATNSQVICDIFGRALLNGYIWPKDRIQTLEEGKEFSFNDSYVYFKEVNVQGKMMLANSNKIKAVEKPYIETKIENSSLYNYLNYKNEIYSNGGSEIYR